MELHGGNLYVEWQWLEYLYQVPKACIHAGTHRFRAGLSLAWENIPQPSHKRRVLIRYGTIPVATCRAYNLPAEQELQAQLCQQQPRQTAARRALELSELLSQAVEENWQGLKSGFTHQLSERAAEPYARLQAALDWCLANTPRPYTRQEVLPAFQDLALPVGPTAGKGSSPEGRYVLFCRKLTAYGRATDKAACLLARRGAPVKNGNGVKMKPIHKEWLINRYADCLKPSLEKTWGDYKAYSSAHGLSWPDLSLPTVRKMLDDNRPAWEARRHGLAEAHKRIGYTMKKEKPSAPDLLLEFDGTEEPFYFRGELGKRAGDVYAVRVFDMHSGAIVGSAYGQTETGELVREALQDYLLRQQRVPHQFRYDKGAANLSQPVQELLTATGAVHFPSRAHRATARRSEQLLGQFQHQCQVSLPGFRGSNYASSRNLDLKPHPDRLAEEWKHETRQSIIARCREAEDAWNNTPNADGLTRWQRYESQGEKGRALPLQRLADLLFVERKRPVRYATHCLELETPDGKHHHFEPQTAEGSPDMTLHGHLVGHSLRVWEMQDGSRERVLVRRADGTGGWLELRAKRAWAEAIADKQPAEERARALVLAAADASLLSQAALVGLLELGPNGQSKEDWNAATRRAEMDAADRATASQSRPKRPAPVLAAVPETAGSSWFLDKQREAAANAPRRPATGLRPLD